MSDPEKEIFIPGRRYAPKFDFSRLGSHFVTGEHLVFKRAAYSRYDDVYCHEFVSESAGSPVKTWFPLQEEKPEDWQKYFCPIDPSVANDST